MKVPICLALAFLPALAAPNLRIDHATVCGADLTAMRKALTTSANLPTEYGGPHSNHATEMALVSFPDGSYIELMGIQPDADPAAVTAHVWSKFLRNNAGPCAFALRTSDVNAAAAQLQSAGIHVGKPEASGRLRPDGVRLSWETLDIGSGPRGGLFPFLIRDVTPRELRAFPTGKPTTTAFAGISTVVVGVQDLNNAIAQYRKAFALPAPRRERNADFGADLAWFEGTPIVLAQGLSPDSWLSRRVKQYGPAPVGYLLTPTGKITGDGRSSKWFGHAVLWTNEVALGWHLGILSL